MPQHKVVSCKEAHMGDRWDPGGKNPLTSFNLCYKLRICILILCWEKAETLHLCGSRFHGFERGFRWEIVKLQFGYGRYVWEIIHYTKVDRVHDVILKLGLRDIGGRPSVKCFLPWMVLLVVA